MFLSILLIVYSFIFTNLNAQFKNVNIKIDNQRLKESDKQISSNINESIKNFFLLTNWGDEIHDLAIPLDIQVLFEGIADKGSERLFSAQFLFNTGIDQRYFSKTIQFPYSFGQNINYSPVIFEPLSGFLAFYGHLIVAGTIDTYEFKGGNTSYELARDLALRGSSSDFKKGWSSRITIVDNLDRNNGLRKARLAWYIALDMFKERDIEGALEEINLMLDGVEESYRDLGRDFNTQYFLKANCEKIVSLLTDLNQPELLKDMKELDPDRREIYQQALESNFE